MFKLCFFLNFLNCGQFKNVVVVSVVVVVIIIVWFLLNKCCLSIKLSPVVAGAELWWGQEYIKRQRWGWHTKVKKYFQFVSLISSFLSVQLFYLFCKKYISLKWLRYICYDGTKSPYYKHSLSKASQEPIRAAKRVWGIDKTQLEIAVPI